MALWCSLGTVSLLAGGVAEAAGLVEVGLSGECGRHVSSVSARPGGVPALPFPRLSATRREQGCFPSLSPTGALLLLTFVLF